jgi:sugar porter (SP) family MFS transporter
MLFDFTFSKLSIMCSDIGCSSSVVRIFGSGAAEFNLDPFQLGFVASSSLFGAMAASAFLIFAGDKFIGRKLELQAASVLYLLGTALQSFAPSLNLLYLGRIVYGLGIGTAMHVAPLYIAETSPDTLRGKLVSLKEAAIVGGIVLGYGAGALFGADSSWRAVYECALPFEAMMLFGALVVPESPRWLALRGRPEEATEALVRAQGLSETEAAAQIETIAQFASTDTAAAPSMDERSEGSTNDENTIKRIKEIFDSKYNRRALVIGIGLVLFQQLSGQPSVLYFANRIFESAGLGFEAALGVGVFKLIMTVASASLVENPNWGRKSLLMVGNIGVTVSLAGLTGLYYAAEAAGAGGPNQVAVIACILAFVGFYQIGFGPITWLILSEIFPLRSRSAAVSIGTLSNFASNLLVTSLFEAERTQMGEGTLFLQFTLIAAAAVAFTQALVFETRGLSLEEIESKLRTTVDGEEAGE